MVGLLAWAAAGAAKGVGDGMVERAKALREQAMAAIARERELADATLDHQRQLERIEFRESLRGGGGGRRRSGGGSSSGASGEDTGEPVFTVGGSGGGTGGGLMPRDPMALTKPGEKAPDPYDTYGYGAARPAPAAAEAASDLPRPANKGEKLVNRFQHDDGSWRAFSSKTNEEVLLTPPTGSAGAQPSDRPPFIAKPDVEGRANLPRPGRTEALEFEREPDGSEAPRRGSTSPLSQPAMDDMPVRPTGAPAHGIPQASRPSKELSASARGRLERAFRDRRGLNLDPEVFSSIIMEVERLMSEGMTEAQATADVTRRLDREPRVTNPAGTAFSRMLPEFMGGTPADAAPDQVAVNPDGRITGVRPRGSASPASGLQPPPPDVLTLAQSAIARGADRASVIARLRENGFSGEGL